MQDTSNMHVRKVIDPIILSVYELIYQSYTFISSEGTWCECSETLLVIERNFGISSKNCEAPGFK